jgi:hypothetical protein
LEISTLLEERPGGRRRDHLNGGLKLEEYILGRQKNKKKKKNIQKG